MEKFFEESSKLNLIEVQELLLRRYSNIEYILNLEFNEAYKLIEFIYEKEIEEKTWERWLVDYRLMGKDNFISFEEYKNKLISKKVEVNPGQHMTKEQIIKESEEIERKLALKKGGEN